MPKQCVGIVAGHGWEHPAATGRWVLEYVKGADVALLD